MKIGDIIKLTWKTKRYGKARICQHGEMWKIMLIRDSIESRPGIKGPWLMVKPVNSVDLRWIHQTDDPNFSIVSE